MQVFDPSAPKRAANLSINADLLQQAKALGLNLSRVLEDRLSEIVREARRQDWERENQAAIEDYNRRVATRGVFSDGLRRF